MSARFFFPKMSLNRLLLLWTCTGLPLAAVMAFVLHWPGPAFLASVTTWGALRHLNRIAWIRHFHPKETQWLR